MMHPLIEGIIGASASRRGVSIDHSATDRPATPPKRRDLIKSAERARAEGKIPVIAEIKPRILSRPLWEGEAAAYAEAYLDMGAFAISVLTEPTYFLGSLETLPLVRAAVDLPVLRKDFIVEEVQLDEAYADLVLLIAGICPNLSDMVEAARSRGMEPLVEVHREEELEAALDSGARIVGINNRDLSTLEVNLGTFERLAPRAKESDVFLVAESGVHSRDDAIRMASAGADALLVGTAIMKDPTRLKEICGA